MTLKLLSLLFFFSQYFDKVAERIKDTGVSVRKRAIKIIRDMCMSNAGLSGFSDVTSAFIAIISRIGDEESSIQVSFFICETICYLHKKNSVILIYRLYLRIIMYFKLLNFF